MEVFTDHHFDHTSLQFHQLAPEDIRHQRSVLECHHGKLPTVNVDLLRKLALCFSGKLGRKEIAYSRASKELASRCDETPEPFRPHGRRQVSIRVHGIDDY